MSVSILVVDDLRHVRNCSQRFAASAAGQYVMHFAQSRKRWTARRRHPARADRRASATSNMPGMTGLGLRTVKQRHARPAVSW